MNPFGSALTAYHAGQHETNFYIVRDDGFSQSVAVELFFNAELFSPLDLVALEACQGTVLDMGAGAGRHTLELERRGLEVCSLDSLPEAIAIMRKRGILHPVLGNALSWAERSFDTVLMLMNGLGLVETPLGLDRFYFMPIGWFFSGGQLLCDSIDVSKTSVPIHADYRENNVRRGLYPGQQVFRIGYGDSWSEPFSCLHIEFAGLRRHGQKAGWNCELLDEECEGHYLARLTRRD